MTPNPFGIVRAEFLHGRPRYAIFTVPGGEKASRHPSVEHSIPHVISRVPPRVCVNLSSGYHICSVTPSYATRSVRALLSLSLSPPTAFPLPIPTPYPHSSRVAVLFLSLGRPSVRPSVRDLLAIQNLRILVALPAYWRCTHTRTCARAYTHARVDLYCA